MPLTLSLIHDPHLRAFCQYWLDCRRPGVPVTRRSDFDIFHTPALVSHLFLYDFSADGRFTLRVAGEDIRQILPNSVPGMPLERIMPPQFLQRVIDRYRRVCEGPSMMHAVGRVFLNLGGTGVGERIALPLADDTGRVHQLLGATSYRIGDTLNDGYTFGPEEVIINFTPLSNAIAAE